jgi:hypothetical protein
MKKKFSFLLGLALVAPFCQGEPRWCSILGKGPSDALLYPPIARAAFVSGVVLSRVISTPAGHVEDIEAISSPRMLTDAVSKQIRTWTIETDATGGELCETLVIAEFKFRDSVETASGTRLLRVEPGVFRVSVDTERFVIGPCGGVFITGKSFRFFWRSAKQRIRGIFKHRAKPWELGS